MCIFGCYTGGRIDHAHHDGNAKRALEDLYAFDEAVRVAKEMTNDEDTLLIVTSDHSHAFTTQGYTSRGLDILGAYDYHYLNTCSGIVL